MQTKIKIILLTAGLAVPLFTWMYFRFKPVNESIPPIETAGIIPPLKSTDIPMDKYLFSNDSSAEISRPTGTRLKIKPRSFQRKDGQPLNGPVELQVREFHTAMDILRAGITMTVDASKGEFLQSAGMIEMRAFNQGQELELAEKKEVEVGLAGFRKPENCRLYYLKDDRQWTVEDSFQAGTNTVKNETLKKLSVLPAKPVLDDSARTTGRVFYFEGKLSENPKLMAVSSRAWKLVDSIYKPDFDRILRISWDDATITQVNRKKDIFEIVLTRKMSVGEDNEIIKSERFLAKPVFSDEKNDRAFFAHQMKEYENLLAKMKAEAERAQQEADLVNTFYAGKMGIYNIDKLFKCDPQEIIPVTFDFSNKTNKMINKTKVYALYEDDNSVMAYSMQQETLTVWMPEGRRMKFIAVLPDNQVAVVDYEAIKKATAGKRDKLFLKSNNYPAAEFFRKT